MNVNVRTSGGRPRPVLLALGAAEDAGQLVQLLAGETKPTVGELLLKPRLGFGSFHQVPNITRDTVVRDVLMAAGRIGS